MEIALKTWEEKRIVLANHPFEYSDMYTPTPTPTISAIMAVINISNSVPNI